LCFLLLQELKVCRALLKIGSPVTVVVEPQFVFVLCLADSPVSLKSPKSYEAPRLKMLILRF